MCARRAFSYGVRLARQNTIRLRQRDRLAAVREVIRILQLYCLAESVRSFDNELNRHLSQRSAIRCHALRYIQFCFVVCVRYVDCSAGYGCFHCARFRHISANLHLHAVDVRVPVRIRECVAALADCVIPQFQLRDRQRVAAPGRIPVHVIYAVLEGLIVVCCDCPFYTFNCKLKCFLLFCSQIIRGIARKTLIDCQFTQRISIYQRRSVNYTFLNKCICCCFSCFLVKGDRSHFAAHSPFVAIHQHSGFYERNTCAYRQTCQSPGQRLYIGFCIFHSEDYCGIFTCTFQAICCCNLEVIRQLINSAERLRYLNICQFPGIRERGYCSSFGNTSGISSLGCYEVVVGRLCHSIGDLCRQSLDGLARSTGHRHIRFAFSELHSTERSADCLIAQYNMEIVVRCFLSRNRTYNCFADGQFANLTFICKFDIAGLVYTLHIKRARATISYSESNRLLAVIILDAIQEERCYSSFSQSFTLSIFSSLWHNFC